MRPRVELQAKLEEILGNKHVYYQLPESIKMEYPAIVYSIKDIESRHADDQKYSKLKCYELIVISKTPNDRIIDSLLDLPYISYDRSYKADNLNHDVFIIYY